MRAPQRAGDWGHWHVPSQGPCWSAPQLYKWRSPSCDPSCGWGYVILAACVSTYAALLNPALKSAPICPDGVHVRPVRSEEHTSELQSHSDLVCRLLLEKKKTHIKL